MQNKEDSDKANWIDRDEVALQIFEVSLNDLIQNKLKAQFIERTQDIPSFKYNDSKTVDENNRELRAEFFKALIEHPGGGEIVKGKNPKQMVVDSENYYNEIKKINQTNNPIEKLQAFMRLIYTLGYDLDAEVGGDLMSPLTIDLLTAFPREGASLIIDLLSNSQEEISAMRRDYETTHKDTLNILTKEQKRIEKRLEKIKNKGDAKAVERAELASKLSKINQELNVWQSSEYSFINLISAASYIHASQSQRQTGK